MTEDIIPFKATNSSENISEKRKEKFYYFSTAENKVHQLFLT